MSSFVQGIVCTNIRGKMCIQDKDSYDEDKITSWKLLDDFAFSELASMI